MVVWLFGLGIIAVLLAMNYADFKMRERHERLLLEHRTNEYEELFDRLVASARDELDTRGFEVTYGVEGVEARRGGQTVRMEASGERADLVEVCVSWERAPGATATAEWDTRQDEAGRARFTVGEWEAWVDWEEVGSRAFGVAWRKARMLGAVRARYDHGRAELTLVRPIGVVLSGVWGYSGLELGMLPRMLFERARRADPLSPLGQAARVLCDPELLANAGMGGALSVVDPGARGALSTAAGESGAVTQVE